MLVRQWTFDSHSQLLARSASSLRLRVLHRFRR
jgi:hypothetical protein